MPTIVGTATRAAVHPRPAATPVQTVVRCGFTALRMRRHPARRSSLSASTPFSSTALRGGDTAGTARRAPDDGSRLYQGGLTAPSGIRRREQLVHHLDERGAPGARRGIVEADRDPATTAPEPGGH